jgi:hypothetical protein
MHPAIQCGLLLSEMLPSPIGDGIRVFEVRVLCLANYQLHNSALTRMQILLCMCFILPFRYLVTNQLL